MIGLTAVSDWWLMAYYNEMDGLEVNVYKKELMFEESSNGVIFLLLPVWVLLFFIMFLLVFLLTVYGFLFFFMFTSTPVIIAMFSPP